MKKLVVSVLAIAFFSLSSCNNIMDQVQEGQTGTQTSTQTGTDKSGQLIEATKTSSVKYQHDDDKPNIIEVPVDASQMEISGLKNGQKIWFTKTNPTKIAIAAKYTRYISSVKNISLSESTASREAVDLSPSFSCVSLDLNANLPSIEQFQERAADNGSENQVSKIIPVVNETTKEIYVDKDNDIKQFEEKIATLRAVGENCYVWVVGDKNDTTYWTDEDFVKTTQKVNSEIVQKIAGCFDKVYPMVKKVFGDESDLLLYRGWTVNMDEYSDTGTKVNIVIHDIGGDFGKTSTNGMLGYFHSKDFYHQYTIGVTQYSNSGKYIYIDAYYSANETCTVLSTLAHEFQHMIDFNTKTISTFNSTRLTSSTWYNEMKSMLCEDIMKDYFKKLYPEDFTDEDTPWQRLPLFCRNYYAVGLEYKTGENNVYYSYANNYAFGAWAARNYGGISFINRLSTNNSVNIESIQDAAGVSITEMLRDYTAACVIQKEDYGFNKKVTQDDSDLREKFICDDYDYPLDAIDLWNLKEILPDSYYSYLHPRINSNYSFTGPVCFAYNARYDLRPYGIGLVSVGTVNFADENESIVTLNFNTENIDNAQRTYIIIE